MLLLALCSSSLFENRMMPPDKAACKASRPKWIDTSQLSYEILKTIYYIKRLGMFPFKVKLFQGCKSETEPINIKSVMQHVIRYQVLLAAYYKVF
jgi:hypothetical protein